MARELMRILTSDGIFDVEVRDPVERSLLGGYWNQVRLFLEGQQHDLEQFEGARVAGRQLAADSRWIQLLGELGILEFEEIYSYR
jgi:hypothetical protein